MTKLKQPLYSLDAVGSLGDSLSFTHRQGVPVAEAKPQPIDRRTLAQYYQRCDYQDYVAWWHQLSAATQRTWQSNASRYHMSGFAYWMKDRLTDLTNLEGRWRMDGGSATQVLDSSRNSNNAVPFGTTPLLGVLGRGRYFDGIDDYLQVPYHSSLDIRDELTLEVFANFHSSKNHYIFERPTSYELIRYVDDKLTFYIRISGAWHGIRTVALLSDLTTYHLAATRDQVNGMLLYIDGVPQATVTVSGVQNPPGLIDTGNYYQFGRYAAAGDFWFHGLLDNALLYDRVLSASDVLRHSLWRYP